MNIDAALKNDIAHNGDLIKTASGDIGTVSGIANLKLALFHRLLTVPGTLIHRPGYGIGVSRFQSALSSFAQQQKLASLIIDQFKLDPRVESISRVSVQASDLEPQKTVIQVFVTAVGYTEQLMEFTPFNLGKVA